mgnify:CR=1 FL=1
MGEVDYKSKWVPYAGIGIGNPFSEGRRIKLNAELGFMYTNSPRVSMKGFGEISDTANKAEDIEDALSSFKFYPVLNVGISYIF